MQYAYLLSKQDLKLSSAEVIAQTKVRKISLFNNLLICNKKISNPERLAYTNKIYQVLFSSTKKDFEKKFKSYPWKKIYEKDFGLRFHNTNHTEKQFAKHIYQKIPKAKVNLSTPSTLIEVFTNSNKFICLKLLTTLKHTFEERKAHKRPSLHPSSIHPRLARCLINLTGIQKGTIYDPFVGSGGILIEAALIGLKGIGYDIDPIMLKRAKINLTHYHLKAKLKLQDATTIPHQINYLVTDLPYGKSTKAAELNQLYTQFLSLLKKKLKKRAVIAFPDFINYRKLIKNAKLTIKQEFTYYLHKSLQKKIIVVET